LTPPPALRVLNLGCGRRKLDFPEAGRAARIVGVDLYATTDADVVHDLDVYPYPFGDSEFDLILLQDVIEHVRNVPATLAEVHRLCADGGEVRFRTPHYSSYYAYSDPTHRHYFSSLAFDDFCRTGGSPYAPGAEFELERRRILFPRIWRMTGIGALANRFPERWEQLFAFVFRAENLEFSLRVRKSERPPART
jgi:SAM-dependent methyltransferase